jgi:hypothetical protein
MVKLNHLCSSSANGDFDLARCQLWPLSTLAMYLGILPNVATCFPC